MHSKDITVPPGTVAIYALSSPEAPDIIRYIGKTTNPHRRLLEHLKRSTKAEHLYRNRWLRKLCRQGLRPLLVVLSTAPLDGWQEEERRWIAHYRAAGMPLTNIADGGQGSTGWHPSPEQVAKLMAGQQRFWDSRIASIRPSASGIRGVTWQSDTQQWLARATIKGVRYTVGVFPTIDTAVAARNTFIEGVQQQAITPETPRARLRGVRRQAGNGEKHAWRAWVTVGGEWRYLACFLDRQEAAQAAGAAQECLDAIATPEQAEEKLSELQAQWQRKTASGLRGINYQAGYGWQSRWVVRISIGGKRYFVGHYRTVEEALQARDAYLLAHGQTA